MHNRFHSLDLILSQYRSLWQVSLYNHLDYPWRDSFPYLCQWLDEMSDEQVCQFKNDPKRLSKSITPWIEEAEELNALSHVPAAKHRKVTSLRGIETGIPGRKWQQIESFVASIDTHKDNWLEWCAGKGYLGRLLATQNARSAVTSIEWQSNLCHEGQTYADKHHLNMTFIEADALISQSQQYVEKDQHAVALHACGDLHTQLLHLAINAATEQVSISPCCYHLTSAEKYIPLSKTAQSTALELTKRDLRLPLQETVTAGKRTQRHRLLEVSYRLGFDLLQRSIFNNQHYLSVPSIKKSLLANGFEFFCVWAAKQKCLELPNNLDFDHWLKQGEKRSKLVDRMDLVQLIFKRPLELWLVLDRALYLQESGYTVNVATFCERQFTPRNILINAKRSHLAWN
ncbi:MAG: methyltransferase [Aliivibrio sp.]|uniref:methyltransferase n=1 Tax=Aliivibrio sp. TaxID=1872443 RepID=UPI001A61BD8F|nr:methyltransferase [Aliivibrio sp.]